MTSLWAVAALPLCIGITFVAFGLALVLAARPRPCRCRRCRPDSTSTTA